MDAFTLAAHLADAHDVDWADDLDADAANRIHQKQRDHGHVWVGMVADPQPPMRGPDEP